MHRAQRFRIYRRSLVLSVVLTLWGVAISADLHAQSPGGPGESPQPRDVYVVLAGGVSLGNYEAGYLATAVEFLRENRDRYRLRGLAGTSAGGINALAGALEYCRVDSENLTRTSVNYDAWLPISWRMLYDEDKVTDEAVFHNQGLRAHGASILKSGRYRLREDCNLWVQVAVTQDLSLTSLQDAQDSVDMVEYLGVRVTADANGHVVYRQLPPRADVTPRRVALLSDRVGVVAPMEVMNMLVATAAFPVAFPRVTMTVQEGSEEFPDRVVHRSEKQYYDGGVFDNVPVRAIQPFLARDTLAANAVTSDSRDSERGAEPLVLVLDLNNQRVPPVVSTRDIAGNIGKLAGSWLSFARARDYAVSMQELENEAVEVWRAQQRYPVAGGFLSAFAAFFDRDLRRTDYALGVHDALEDLEGWAPAATHKNLSANTQSVDACVHHLLLGGNYTECATPPNSNMLATLRGLSAAAASRCSEEDVTSMGCAMFAEEALSERLPEIPTSEKREARLRGAPGKAPVDDFQAFLEELRFGDFEPEMNGDWLNLRGAKARRPEVLWSRLVEDALRQFARKQPRPVISSEVAFEALLSSALPVLPRPSASALINLSSLEVTMNLPVASRVTVDLGVTAEWASRKERTKGWHLFSGGPVVRAGWILSKRNALVASIADVHAGVLFGPTFDSVVHGGNGPGSARNSTRPNAAAFVGIAPRFVLLRRLQVDIPVRVYWQCDTPMCTSFSSPRPGYSIAFRLGWNWTLSPRIRGARVEE